jgi:hypothetical protein
VRLVAGNLEVFDHQRERVVLCTHGSEESPMNLTAISKEEKRRQRTKGQTFSSMDTNSSDGCSSARTTTGLIKYPTTSSRSELLRPAIGVPTYTSIPFSIREREDRESRQRTSTSRWPEHRYSRMWKAASSTENRLDPDARASRCSEPASDASSSNRCEAPR